MPCISTFSQFYIKIKLEVGGKSKHNCITNASFKALRHVFKSGSKPSEA